jgi:hypothetical protein
MEERWLGPELAASCRPTEVGAGDAPKEVPLGDTAIHGLSIRSGIAKPPLYRMPPGALELTNSISGFAATAPVD